MLNEVSAVNRYTGDNSTVNFPYGFCIVDQADIEVSLDGSIQTLTTHYSVSGVGNAGGGTVTFVTAPGTGVRVTLLRTQPKSQDSDYAANEAFPSERVEQDLDKLAMIAQEHTELFSRTLRAPRQDALDMILPSVASRASNVLGFTAAGLPTAVPLPTAGGGDLSLSTVLSTSSTTARTLAERFAEVYNVKDYGAVGDGVADDTTVIQAAINAADDGAIIYFPRVAVGSYYKFSTLTSTKNLTFRGDGWYNYNQTAFGNAQWATASDTTGSVLRSTATSGAAITSATQGKTLRLEKLAIVGPGSGTSIGVDFGGGSNYQIYGAWNDVLIGNFSTDVRLDNVQDHTFIGVRFRGATLGLQLQNSANQNVFLNAEFQGTVTAHAITNTEGVQFLGGLAQNGITTFASLVAGSSGIKSILYEGMYYESSGMVLAAFDTTDGNVQHVMFRDTLANSTGTAFSYTGTTFRVNWLGLENNKWQGYTVNFDTNQYTFTTVGKNNRFAAITGAASTPSFTNADTTPSVLNSDRWLVTNSAPTTITDLDDGYEGQIVTLKFSDGNTTIQDGTNFQLSGGANFTSSADDTMMLISIGGIWYELSRSVN